MPFSNKPIVCINGSRTITDINLDNYLNPDDYSEVIAGEAAGVDTLARNWALRHKLEYAGFPARWDVYGKEAGLVRNKEMLDYCDLLVSFWNGKSTGTLHAIRYAQEKGLPYQVHLIEDLD